MQDGDSRNEDATPKLKRGQIIIQLGRSQGKSISCMLNPAVLASYNSSKKTSRGKGKTTKPWEKGKFG